MTQRLVNFTRGEARALLSTLDATDTLAPLLGGLHGARRDWIKNRCRELAAELNNPSPFVVLYHDNIRRAEDRRILGACVTYSKYHETAASSQAYVGALRVLHNARTKLAQAFEIDPEDIPFPQA